MVPLPLKNSHNLNVRPNPNGHGLPIYIIEDKGIISYGINLIRRFLRIPLFFLVRKDK